MPRRHLLCFAMVALLLASTTAGAASITPASFSATIGVGESVVVEKFVTLDPAAVGVVDIYFLADNTGSMGGVINNVKTVAGSLLTELGAAFASAQFGVGRYLGDPTESGVNGNTAYDVLQSITSNSTAVQTAINAWFASGGGDGPEANLYALHQAATDGALTAGGVGSGESVDWRDGAVKVIVWFGDANGHTETVSLAQTISALTSNDVIVVAMNSRAAGFGIDGTYGGDPTRQATAIAAGTGGTLFDNFASVPVASVVDTIKTAVGLVTADIDLVFAHTMPAGVTVEFIETDPLGYDDVPGGATRIFSVRFTGVTPGDYGGTIFFRGVDAVEEDRILVGDVPEPSTLALVGVGLLGLGAVVRRRRRP